MSLIKLVDVSKYYKSEETVSVGMKRINLEFELGEFVAVTGESGSGKSTLLNVISGLDGYEEGELYLFGEETSHYTISDWERYRGAYIGFVFQNYNIIDSYTVYQNVLLALEVQGYDPKTRKKRALELIEQVGLTSHKHHKASKLSGGQKQRTVIARALAKDCPVIVADEPTGNLDSASGTQIMSLLHEISKNKLVIVVTHDYDQVKSYATRKIKMHDGEVVEDKKVKAFEKAELTQKIKPRSLPFITMIRFAVRNLLAQPKKLIFLLLLQILVIGAFTITYSERISSVREAGLSQSDYYNNVPKTRLLIEKRDGSQFTQSELNQLKANRNINEVYEHAFLFYNKENLMMENLSRYGYYFISKTDSHRSINNNDISGNRPKLINEIVVGFRSSDIQIGDEVELTVGYSKDTAKTFIVSGIDKLNRETIYFSDAYLNQEVNLSQVIDYERYNEIVDMLYYNMYFNYQSHNYQIIPVNIGTFDLSLNGQGSRTTLTNQTITISINTDYGFDPFTIELTGVSISVPQIIDSYRQILMRQSLFNQIVTENISRFESYYQPDDLFMITVTVNGYSAGSRLIKSLDIETYRVYYPSYIASPLREFLVFFQGLVAVIFLTIFGLFLYSIVHAVSKNVMNSRKKDFAIFRSIGTNRATLARLVVLEQMIMATIGFIIALLLMGLIGEYMYFLKEALDYIELRDYFYLLFIFVLFGGWLGLRFNKRVFNQSVIETLTQSKGD